MWGQAYGHTNLTDKNVAANYYKFAACVTNKCWAHEDEREMNPKELESLVREYYELMMVMINRWMNMELPGMEANNKEFKDMVNDPNVTKKKRVISFQYIQKIILIYIIT